MPIDGYVTTSAGVLLVRCGKTLSAIDGKDGTDLWAMKDLEIGGWERFNLLEIPGTPIVLINRTSRAGVQSPGQLLAVDYWTGSILWRQPETHDFLELIPFYENERMLLITRKVGKLQRFWQSLGPALGVSYKPRLQLQSMFSNQVSWVTEYPRTFEVGMRVFYEHEGQVYQMDSSMGDLYAASIDLRTGEQAWKFFKRYVVMRSFNTSFAIVPGKVLLAGKDLIALDALTGKPAWSVQGIGGTSALLQNESMVYAMGKKGMYALDVATGAVRWQTKSDKYETNPVLLDEENKLAVFENSELAVLDASNGRTLNRTHVKLPGKPKSIRRAGRNFLLVNTDEWLYDPFTGETLWKDIALYNLTTGETLWFEQKVHALFSPISFLTSHTSDEVVLYLISGRRMRERLQAAWAKLQERAKQNPTWGRVLERLEPALQEGADEWPVVAYATKVDKDRWKIVRIDRSTGQRYELDLTGSQPHFVSTLGLAYTTTGNILRAYKIPEN